MSQLPVQQQQLAVTFVIAPMSLGSESKVPAGVLTVSLELYPPLTETLTADIISTQVSTLEALHGSLCLFIKKKEQL